MPALVWVVFRNQAPIRHLHLLHSGILSERTRMVWIEATTTSSVA
jgi:hypothetical protein